MWAHTLKSLKSFVCYIVWNIKKCVTWIINNNMVLFWCITKFDNYKLKKVYSKNKFNDIISKNRKIFSIYNVF